MKLNIISAILLMFILGCSIKTSEISGTQDLIPNEQDLQQLEMESIADCQTEEQTSYSSNLVQYSVCYYTINSLEDAEIVLELRKFTNFDDLDNSYQYDSSHLYSAEGLISENDFGDKSRFRVNNENDYMGQLNEPGIYYYHLWICKDKYLIHITSKGSKEAKDYISETGKTILSKFG